MSYCLQLLFKCLMVSLNYWQTSCGKSQPFFVLLVIHPKQITESQPVIRQKISLFHPPFSKFNLRSGSSSNILTPTALFIINLFCVSGISDTRYDSVLGYIIDHKVKISNNLNSQNSRAFSFSTTMTTTTTTKPYPTEWGRLH